MFFPVSFSIALSNINYYTSYKTQKKAYYICRSDCMIKIISNLVPGNENDYMEHKEFENDINRFIYENPGYKLKDMKILGEELVAVLVKEKKQYYVGNVHQPHAAYNTVSELINKMESFITEFKKNI